MLHGQASYPGWEFTLSLCAGLARSFARGDQNRSPMLAERLRKLTNEDDSAEKQALALKTTPPAAAGTTRYWLAEKYCKRCGIITTPSSRTRCY